MPTPRSTWPPTSLACSPPPCSAMMRGRPPSSSSSAPSPRLTSSPRSVAQAPELVVVRASSLHSSLRAADHFRSRAVLSPVIAYLHYLRHSEATGDPTATRACFCTAPTIRSLPAAFFCEAIGTCALVLPILLMGPSYVLDASGKRITLGLGAIGPLPVG